MLYDEWIAENIKTDSDAYGQCRQASELMLATFPELRLAKGHYLCPIWGEREHWWLVAPDGSIVDPTAAQFPSKGAFEYVELDPEAEAPCGMCANCGKYCYASKGGGDTVCGDACHDSYVAYLTGG